MSVPKVGAVVVLDQRFTTFSEIVVAYWPIAAVAFLGSLLTTPLCRRYALARNIVDRPDDWLKTHTQPIPYLGGAAIFVGWAFVVHRFGMVRVDSPPSVESQESS